MDTAEWGYKRVTDRWAVVTALVAVVGFYGTVVDLFASGQIPSLGAAGIVAAVVLMVVTARRQKHLQHMIASRIYAQNLERQRQEQLRQQRIEQERQRLAREAAERKRAADARLAASRQRAQPAKSSGLYGNAAPLSDDEMRQRAWGARMVEDQAIRRYLQGQYGPLAGSSSAIADWRFQEGLDPMKRLGRAMDPLGLRPPLGGPRIGPPPLGS